VASGRACLHPPKKPHPLHGIATIAHSVHRFYPAMLTRSLITTTALILLAGTSSPLLADPLQEFAGCILETADWSDGDSFPVTLPDGKKVTVRLYGVDCMEMHVDGDDSNARRLRDQRRWFGIADILVAKSMGEAAKTKVTEILSKPFTVHTAFADARGDVRYARVYGFVTTSDGSDLAEYLVRAGLARAFGVARARPDGTTAAEWREHLRDLELQAATRAAGAWAQTDWERLPEERRQARAEQAELDIAKGLKSALAPGEKINLNTAARDALMNLPGIGEAIALRIIEHRPYASIEDILEVPGIGAKTLEKLQPLLTISEP
jgi:competence protein ComEA